jgi:hypothetical protein
MDTTNSNYVEFDRKESRQILKNILSKNITTLKKDHSIKNKLAENNTNNDIDNNNKPTEINYENWSKHMSSAHLE